MKKILAILLSIMLAASLGISAAAEEGAEAFDISDCTILSKYLALEFNKAVDFDKIAQKIVLTDSDGVQIDREVEKISDTKVKIIPQTALDINKTYTLSASYIIDMSGKNIIKDYKKTFSFSSIFEDDFESYATEPEKLSEVYALRAFSSSPVGATSALPDDGSVKIEDGRLALSAISGKPFFIRKKNVSKKTDWTVEYDVENAMSGKLSSVIGYPAMGDWVETYFDIVYGDTRARCRTAYNQNQTVIDMPNLSNDNSTYAFHTVNQTGDESDKFEFFINGNLQFSTEKNETKLIKADGTYNTAASKTKTGFIDAYSDTSFGIFTAQSGQVIYIDNLKIYSVDESIPEEKTLLSVSELENLRIDGNPSINNMVSCLFDGYFNPNITVNYEWYRGDDYFASFPENWEKIDNTSEFSSQYVITENDIGKYVVCQATLSLNISDTESIVLFSQKSLPIYEISAPKALNCDLVYTEEENDVKKLTFTYEYFDPNNDAEDGTEFVWEQSADNKDGSWITLANNQNVYILSESDLNKFLRCTIKVKNKAEKGNEAIPITLNYTLPFAPAAKNVVISGETTVGSTLTAKYDYYDENGDKESVSDLKWYRTDSNGNATVIGNGLAYGVKYDDRGYDISFGVTPKNETYPENGEEKLSNIISIPKPIVNSGSGSSSSSGGSGGSGGSVTVSVPTSKPSVDTNTQNNKNEQDIESNENEFLDMENHWAKNTVNELYKLGLVNGRDNGFFPEEAITRAEWTVMVLRAIKKDSAKEYQNCFSDISSEDWYAKDIQAAYTLGIINGNGNEFYPNEKISREQMAKIAVDAYELVNGKITAEGNLDKFSDKSTVSSWAEDHLTKAVNSGIINGVNDDSLLPQKTATRAEAATVLKRVYDMLSKN